MAEWLKAPDSKSGLGAILTWVRIPPLPPASIFGNEINTAMEIFPSQSPPNVDDRTESEVHIAFRCASVLEQRRIEGLTWL